MKIKTKISTLEISADSQAIYLTQFGKSRHSMVTVVLPVESMPAIIGGLAKFQGIALSKKLRLIKGGRK